jgi:hypothetical protein
MNRYLVTSPISHDGKRYVPGQTIALDHDQALELLKLGAIARAPAAEGEATPLPEDFPARQPLIDAGYVTVESLAGLTADELTTLRGIGAATAAKILEALAE